MADTLAARVAAAQALAAAATPGPWLIDERVRCAAIVAPADVDSPGLGRDYAGVLAFWMPSQRWHLQHEDKHLTVWDPPRGNMEMMAAAPDLVALVTDLWEEASRKQEALDEFTRWARSGPKGCPPYSSSVAHDLARLDETFAVLARVEELIRVDRSEAERERDEARRNLARIVALCGWDCDGNDPETPAGAIHLYGSAVQAVREMRAEMDEAQTEAGQAEKERDAYKRAKAENDERFMIERDEARAEVTRLRALLTRDGATWGEHCAGLGEPTTPTED